MYKIQPKNGTDVVAFLGGMGIHFLAKCLSGSSLSIESKPVLREVGLAT